MARELAKTHPVIYVNHPYSLKDIFNDWRKGDVMVRRRLVDMLLLRRNRYETLDSVPQNFIAVQPPATLPVNWMPYGRVYRFFQRVNNRIVLTAIKKAIKRQHCRDFVYINCYDPFFAGTIPADMGARLRIYHCIDDISQNNYTARHGVRLEHEAAAAADITFVTSTNLYHLKAPYAKRIVHYFNAADVDNFSRVRTEAFSRPALLDGKKGKVIGFIGNLDELRIDYPLLKKIALTHSDKTLLLIGPINSPELQELGIDRLPNVVLAGSRRLHDLPPLLQHCDVAIIPFLKNTLTKSIYPLKINEYLAAGKPVVATDFSEDIKGFGHCAYIAPDHESFLHLIHRAIAEDSPVLTAQRCATAAQNTWAARIEHLHRLVSEYGKAPTSDQSK